MRTEFRLDEKQQTRLESWAKKFETQIAAAFEEDCAPMSPFVYVINPGPIGDDIKVYLFNLNGPCVDLSLDDDGLFMDGSL